MGKDFTATIKDPERAALFQKALGRTTVNIESPLPCLADLPGKGISPVFLLDLECLTDDERVRLAEAVAEKWGLPVDEVIATIRDCGVPILAEDCYVMIEHPERWI